MKKLAFLLTSICLAIICNCQTKKDLFDWKDFSSDSAGFKIKSPCILSEWDKSNQQSKDTLQYQCIEKDYRIKIIVGKFKNAEERERAIANLKFVSKDFKIIYPGIIKSESKDYTKDEIIGLQSDYELTNKDKIKNLYLIDQKSVFNVVIYITRSSNQSDDEFNEFYTSLSEKMVDSFELVKK